MFAFFQIAKSEGLIEMSVPVEQSSSFDSTESESLDLSDSDSPPPTPIKNDIYESVEEEDKSSLPEIPEITKEDVKAGCLGIGVCCIYVTDCYLSMFMTEAAIHVQETTPEGSVEHCCASMETGTCLCETCGCDGLSQCYLDWLKQVNDCLLPECCQECAWDVGDCEADFWGDCCECFGGIADFFGNFN